MPRRLPPPDDADPRFRQLWRIVDGAVRDCFGVHPDYLAKSERVVRRSLLKRVVGALDGYAEQSAKGGSGSSPAA